MQGDQPDKRKTTAMGNKGSDEGIFASCSFADLGLHTSLCEHLKDKMGFKVPTQIQAQAIPVILSGKDALVNAATGTGKTIVYLAPIVNLLQKQKPRVERSDGTFEISVLVLVPTRELCLQVHEILQKLLRRFIWIVPGYIMGGENRAKEKARLRKGISILIATPGRLLDHLKHTSSFMYKNLQWIVYDEADRILELGYGKAIEEILDLLGSRKNSIPVQENMPMKPNKISRQNLLLSATLNEKVNHLANISLQNPVMIGLNDKKASFMSNSTLKQSLSLDSDNDEELEPCIPLKSQSMKNYNLPSQLIQRYVKVPCGSRLVLLLSILKSLLEKAGSQKCWGDSTETLLTLRFITCNNIHHDEIMGAEWEMLLFSIAVFLSTCDAVDFHFSLLKEFKWSANPQQEPKQKLKFITCNAFRLHGSMPHEDRREAFQGFKSEKSAVLLCTDVAARGLDIPNVTCIIQYDSPGEASEYVHRVGRTARLGEKGEALLFLQPAEIDYLHDLKIHGAFLSEYSLQKLLGNSVFHAQNHHHNHRQKLLSLDSHPWVILLQMALERFVLSEMKMMELAKNAFCSWIRAYTAHRGDLRKIFMLKKLHLGHVARSFGLREQPSLVSKSLQKQEKKRRRVVQLKGRPFKRRQIPSI